MYSSTKSTPRKHSAVRQSGPKKGTLKKGFKYVTNMLGGLPFIKKAPKKKVVKKPRK